MCSTKVYFFRDDYVLASLSREFEIFQTLKLKLSTSWSCEWNLKSLIVVAFVD